MTNVKRYRKRDLIRILIEKQGDAIPPAFRPEFIRSAKMWPIQYLTFIFRDLTGLELVPTKGGIWYGMADTDQGEQ